jgi:hypothetical protein
MAGTCALLVRAMSGGLAEMLRMPMSASQIQPNPGIEFRQAAADDQIGSR